MKIVASLVTFYIIFISQSAAQRYEGSCGVSRQGGVGLIVGGEIVNKGEFPWLVALLQRNQENVLKFFCGAALISKTKILTAAHCVHNKNAQEPVTPRDVIALLGAHNLELLYEPGTISVSPTRIFVHPHWNPFVTRFDADLAMLFIEDENNFPSTILPICMLSPTQNAFARQGTIAGFGQSEDKTKRHEKIPRKLTVAIKDNAECFLNNFEFAKISSNRTFCAGLDNGMGACRGDSGSGLFIKIKGVFYLKGIVSSSLFDEDGNCDVLNDGVYTNVIQYLKWIEDPSNPNSLVEEEPPKQPVNQLKPHVEASCGLMSQASNLIQGGSKASRETFPWTVAIYVKQSFDLYEQKAVGTLISNKHVVSIGSALCQPDGSGNLRAVTGTALKLNFGISDLQDSHIAGVLIIDGAERIVLHPNINFNVPRSADIAVTFLQSPIYFTNVISPACFVLSGKNDATQVGYAVGWGINEAGDYSSYKKFSQLQVQSEEICSKFYKNSFGKNYFCAASRQGSTPCELDDPFYMKIDGIWFLRGLMNFYYFRSDVNKCQENSPVLYEDVAVYSNWIQATIN